MNDEADQPSVPAPRDRIPWWGWTGIGLAVLLVGVGIAGFVVHVDYTTLSPGDALPLAPRIRIEGAKAYPDAGDVRLLFVRERVHVNVWQFVWAELQPNTDILSDSDANGGVPNVEAEANAVADMADAKLDAPMVALEAAGYHVTRMPGLVVQAVYPDRPAAAVLRAGDVILSADGVAVVNGSELGPVIQRHRPGTLVQLVVSRDGRRQTVRSKVAVDRSDAKHPTNIIGVRVHQRYGFPVRVTVDTSNIGGPSAGLAMALAIYDQLTPGSLTGGARVAVTGTIGPRGNVGEIGGIAQKAVAVRASHAALFIVPKCDPNDPPVYLATCRDDLRNVERRVAPRTKVVAVASFDEALAALRAIGGAVQRPVTTTTAAASV